MPRRPSAHPTEGELEVLSVLWREGPSTVRQVHEALHARRGTGLTTTLKILQIMAEKGLVLASDTRPHLFSPADPEETTQAGLLRNLAEKAFHGSVRKLLVRAVEEGGLDEDELREIRRLIDTLQKSKRGGP